MLAALPYEKRMKPVASIDKCTTCSACVVHCPVTAATRLFNGPKLTGPSSERFRLFAHGEIDALGYCSNCKNCDISCPCNVHVSALNMLAKARYTQQHPAPLCDRLLAHGRFMADAYFRAQGVLPSVVQPLTHAFTRLCMHNRLTRSILDKVGIDARAPLPMFERQSFTSFMRMYKQPAFDKQVLFFPGCYINDYDLRTGMDTVHLLNAAGFYVQIPAKAHCCGLPLISNGFMEKAQQCATTQMAAFTQALQHNIPILTACTSCSLMFTQDYEEFFPDIVKKSGIATAVYDVGEFLWNLVEQGDWQPHFRTSPTRLLYHAPCHLRAQGTGSYCLELVRFATKTYVEEARAGCCGMAGSYGFKKRSYDVARLVGQDLFTAVRNSAAEYALTECGTCRLQISHHTHVPSIHPLSWLRGLLL